MTYTCHKQFLKYERSYGLAAPSVVFSRHQSFIFCIVRIFPVRRRFQLRGSLRLFMKMADTFVAVPSRERWRFWRFCCIFLVILLHLEVMIWLLLAAVITLVHIFFCVVQLYLMMFRRHLRHCTFVVKIFFSSKNRAQFVYIYMVE